MARHTEFMDDVRSLMTGKSTKRDKFTHNKEFFAVMTKEAAYWSAFVATHGFADIDNRALRVRVDVEDLHHLDLFAQAINYSGPTMVRPYQFTEDDYPDSSVGKLFVSRAAEICLDLTWYYGVGDKSRTPHPPNFRGDVALTKSYLAGYIEGRARIYTKNRLRLYIHGDEEMLTWVKACVNILWPARSDAKRREFHVKSLGNYCRLAIERHRAEDILTDLVALDLPKLKRFWAEFTERMNKAE